MTLALVLGDSAGVVNANPLTGNVTVSAAAFLTISAGNNVTLTSNLYITNSGTASTAIYFPDGSIQRTSAANYLTPALGSTGSIQYNNAGAFAGNANFVYTNSGVGIGTSVVNTGNSLVVSSGNIFVNNSIVFSDGTSLSSTTAVTISSVYDLDSISSAVDGFTNTFAPTYNQSPVTLTNPWSIQVTVDGILQPAFTYPNNIMWESYCLSANTGYTIDPSGNIKFAECPQMGAQILVRTQVTGAPPATKQYPFLPTDILVGSDA